MRAEPAEGWLSLNLAALAETQSELAAYLGTVAAAPLELITAKNGALSARREGRWLHSARDPAGEALRVAEASLVAGSDTALVLGTGLGWTLEAALARSSIEKVLVCEADAAKLVAMLGSRDLRHVLGDARLSWMVGGDPGALLAALSDCGAILVSILGLSSLESFDVEWYGELRRVFARWQSKEEINSNTLGRFGRLWSRNLVRNAPFFADLPGIDGLEGSFSGIPALVLAAGPSLDAALPHIAELRRRCLLVAVDTALRSLLAEGVEPDFLVVVDPQYWNWRHIADLPSPSSYLVTEPAVFPPVLRRKQRAIFLAESLFPLGRILAGGGRGILGAGGSVATSAWDFARHLGASTIIMAGLDLGYPQGHTHARASLFEQRALASGSRLAPATTTQTAAFFGAPGEEVAANDGSRIRSDQRMSLYAWWFEARLSRRVGSPTKTLSAVGRAIPGMGLVSLDELFDLPPLRSDIQTRLEGLASQPPPHDSEKRQREALDSLLSGLGRVEASARSGIEAARAGRRAILRGEDPGSALSALERVDAELSASEVRDVAGFLLPPLRQLVGKAPSTLDGSLAQSESLYAAIAASASEHCALLQASRRDWGAKSH